MPWLRHSIVKVALAGIFRHLPNSCLAEGQRTGLFIFIAHQLDDAQHLVAQAGIAAAEQPGKLVPGALLPDPAVEVQGREDASGKSAKEDNYSHEAGRVQDA